MITPLHTSASLAKTALQELHKNVHIRPVGNSNKKIYLRDGSAVYFHKTIIWLFQILKEESEFVKKKLLNSFTSEKIRQLLLSASMGKGFVTANKDALFCDFQCSTILKTYTII